MSAVCKSETKEEEILRLWRPTDAPIPLPPYFLVGPRKGQSVEECNREANRYYDAYEAAKKVVNRE